MSTSKTATLGFCATRNGVEGYVTASHFCRSVGQQVSYNGTVIGTVTQSGYYQNTYADAAFIESNGVAETSNKLAGQRCWATTTYEFPQNTSIWMYGITSGLQSGVIYSYDYTYVPYNPEEYTSCDHILAIYESAGGDSGGPVFFFDGNFGGQSYCTLIGIHSATARVSDSPGTSSVVKYGNMVRMLNISAVLE